MSLFVIVFQQNPFVIVAVNYFNDSSVYEMEKKTF